MGGSRGGRAIVLALLAAAPAVAPALGTGGATEPGGVEVAAGDATHHVHISGLAYDPSSLTIDAGDTVVWHNHDFTTHTATDEAGGWDTGNLGNGQSASLTFSSGAFTYTCVFHGFMTGALTVGASNQAPVVAITAPADGAAVEGTVTVQGTASDADGSVTAVEVRIDGGAWQAATGTTSWSFTWDTTTVADGGRMVEARATDDLGATGTASITAQVGNPPSVAITTPADGATVQDTVTFQGTASDPGPGGAVTLVEVRIDGGAFQAATGTTAWSFAWDTLVVGNGAHLVEARSSDGARFSPLAAITVSVDNPPNQPPTVAIGAPAEGATLAQAVTISGTAADPEEALTKVEVRIDGGPWQLADGTDAWSFAWDTLAFPDGAHLVEARATDNTAQTATAQRNVTVANPPSVALVAPAPGATLRGAITIEGTASDPTTGGGIARVEVRIDGGAWQLAEGTTAWSFAWDTTATADGARTVEARATDTDGTTALASREVTVANPPVVAITAPDGTGELVGVVPVEGTAADTTQGGAIAAVEVRIDGGPWRPATGGASWSYAWPSREVLDGPHLIEARSSDGGLFSELASVAVVTDNYHADLVVAAVAATGGLFSQNVTATVRNDGDEAAGPFAVRLQYLSAQGPKVLGDVAVPGLDIGASATVHVTWNTLGKVGNFTLVATADVGGAVEEHREDNNTGQGIACLPALPADAACLLPRIELT